MNIHDQAIKQAFFSEIETIQKVNYNIENTMFIGFVIHSALTSYRVRFINFSRYFQFSDIPRFALLQHKEYFSSPFWF